MKTHPLNVSYLVVGLAFLGIAGSWALREAGVIDGESVTWLLPLTLVVAGGVGLVAFAMKGLFRGRTDGEPEPTSYDEAGSADPGDTPLTAYDPTLDIQAELDKSRGEER
jgi:hypothetical protein